MALLLHLDGIDEERWRQRLTAKLEGMPIYLSSQAFEPGEISYMLAWKPAPDAFDGLVNLKAVLSLGAGVDALLQHPNLPDAPIVRFVDDDLSQRMSDYVVANVMMHQRLFTRYQTDQKAKVWRQHYPAPAPEINVGIMGLGVIGQFTLERLKPLGLGLLGWARSAKLIDGVQCYSGADGLDEFLAATDILVCLLPLTEDTSGILNYETFSKLRQNGLKGGPVIINAGRGAHQVEADITRALTDGTLAAASLDVFEVEPLPQNSPLWDLSNCYITPHIAGISNPDSGTRYFSKVISAHEAGAPLPNVVDLVRGY